MHTLWLQSFLSCATATLTKSADTCYLHFTVFLTHSHFSPQLHRNSFCQDHLHVVKSNGPLSPSASFNLPAPFDTKRIVPSFETDTLPLASKVPLSIGSPNSRDPPLLKRSEGPWLGPPTLLCQLLTRWPDGSHVYFSTSHLSPECQIHTPSCHFYTLFWCSVSISNLTPKIWLLTAPRSTQKPPSPISLSLSLSLPQALVGALNWLEHRPDAPKVRVWHPVRAHTRVNQWVFN